MADIQVNALPVENSPAMTDSTVTDTGNIVTKRTTWQKIYNLFYGIIFSQASGITATGTNQATARVLNKVNNRIDTVSAGTGVVEDAAAAIGNTRLVQNNGANDLFYYPFGTNQFYQIGSGALGAGNPITIAPGNQVSVFCYNSNELTIK